MKQLTARDMATKCHCCCDLYRIDHTLIPRAKGPTMANTCAGNDEFL